MRLPAPLSSGGSYHAHPDRTRPVRCSGGSPRGFDSRTGLQGLRVAVLYRGGDSAPSDTAREHHNEQDAQEARREQGRS